MGKHLQTTLASLLALTVVGACSANGSGVIEPKGTGNSAGAGVGGEAGSFATGGTGGSGGMNLDGGGGGIDPDAACGYAMIPSEREPGSIMLVYDASCSMDECPNSTGGGCEQCNQGASKWDSAKAAMTQVLNGVPDDVRMGLILFPDTNSGGNCAEPNAAKVSVDSLGKTRGSILSYVSGSTTGGVTPTQQSLQLAYGIMQQISGSGRKAVLLVTDGAWNCGSSDDPIYANAEQNWNDYQIATIAVGVPGAGHSYLSHLAHLGGADRMPGCNGEKPDSLHPFKDPSCSKDETQCCSYVIGNNVETDLVQALKEIASKFLTSCVFKVPKGNDPSKFNEHMVNVYVDGQLLAKGADGWDYVGGSTDALEIFGTTCDELLKGQKDKVEIQLGCQTIVK